MTGNRGRGMLPVKLPVVMGKTYRAVPLGANLRGDSKASYLTSTGKTVVSLISSMTKEAETSDSGTLAINR